MAMAWSLPPFVTPASTQTPPLNSRSNSGGLGSAVNRAGVLTGLDEKPRRDASVLVPVGRKSELQRVDSMGER